MSNIEEKKNIFSDFCHILALKYHGNCQNILNIYSLYKNTTVVEQIKPNILNIYIKTIALPPVEAYLDNSRMKKSTIFVFVSIEKILITFHPNTKFLKIFPKSGSSFLLILTFMLKGEKK